MKPRSFFLPALPTLMALLALVLAGGGCVATQNIPVSSDPLGAVVYLDGKQACQATPCNIAVTKDQDHLLTIVKPGYHQRDVALRRVFDTTGVLKDEIRKGVRKAATGGDASDVLSGAAQNVDKKEQDGSAYVIRPDMVVARLTPADQPRPEDRANTTDDPFADPKTQDQDPAKARNKELDPLEIGIDLYRILKGNTAPE